MFSSLLDVARNSPFRGPLTPTSCQAATPALVEENSQVTKIYNLERVEEDKQTIQVNLWMGYHIHQYFRGCVKPLALVLYRYLWWQ